MPPTFLHFTCNFVIHVHTSLLATCLTTCATHIFSTCPFPMLPRQQTSSLPSSCPSSTPTQLHNFHPLQCGPLHSTKSTMPPQNAPHPCCSMPQPPLTSKGGPFIPMTEIPHKQTTSLHVQSASALTPTTFQSQNAQRSSYGTTSMKPFPNESIKCSLPNPPTSASVPNGNTEKAALTNMHTDTSALNADQLCMELTTALLRRSAPLGAQTPYKPDVWQHFIQVAGLTDCFDSILNSFRYGFIVDFPCIHSIQTPPNSPSVNIYHSQFHEIVQKEITKSRYIGPFLLSTIHDSIRPFQTSPLSIIPKPGQPGKFRLVQNFSFPIIPNAGHKFIHEST